MLIRPLRHNIYIYIITIVSNIFFCDILILNSGVDDVMAEGEDDTITHEVPCYGYQVCFDISRHL